MKKNGIRDICFKILKDIIESSVNKFKKSEKALIIVFDKFNSILLVFYKFNFIYF